MRLLDSRRLTGRNLQSPVAGAVAEVALEEDEADSFLRRWNVALERVVAAVGWTRPQSWYRRHTGGASLGFDAPLDALYAATELNEWAIAQAGGHAPSLEEALPDLLTSINDEADPPLRALQAAAAQRAVPFIWCDDFVTLGMGIHSQTWPRDVLPQPESVSWKRLGAVPVVYITGTNGKTTSTRMSARILSAAGMCAGHTSSDGVVVGDEVVEEGDWTGTGAGRRVLRHTNVEVAVLETARGGLLRRGLVVDICDAALITNVARDHLGEYGVSEVAQMAEVKGLVLQAVRPSGVRVLNADDELLVEIGQQAGPRVIWFTLKPNHPMVLAHLDAGGTAWMLQDGWLVRCEGVERRPLLPAKNIPLSLGGAAQHNVANALGAAAVTHALGVPDEAIRAALQSFGDNATDNPGRCALEDVNGVQVVLDFGHNPHGVRAMLALAERLRAARRGARLAISIGQAGDRTDQEIVELARTVHQARPDLILFREVHGYERGRAAGEVARIMTQAVLGLGQDAASVQNPPDEVSALRIALDWAQPGDLVLSLVHIEREGVQALLQARRS